MGISASSIDETYDFLVQVDKNNVISLRVRGNSNTAVQMYQNCSWPFLTRFGSTFIEHQNTPHTYTRRIKEQGLIITIVYNEAWDFGRDYHIENK